MIYKSRFEGNEIILTGDQNDNATALVENIDFAFIFVGVSQVITGLVVAQLTVPDMLIKVSPGLAYQNTVTIKNLLYLEDEVTNITIQAADPTQTRIDIVEIRRELVDFESESRQFKDPDTSAISTDTIDTKTEYTTEIKVLEGTPGSSAPSVESGWLKIAEVVVGPAVTEIYDANIKNVDAESEGDTNTDWTTDTTVIYRNGTVSDMKTLLVDLDRALGNDSDFIDGLNNTDDGTYFGGSGKAVRDKYGVLTSFQSGIAGGAGTTWLEQIGKEIYDQLYTKSSGGGYANNEIMLYSDTTGRGAKTSNKTISESGYTGTDGTKVPTEDNIGDMATDFPAGQGGTSGGSLMRQLGYNFRTTQTRLYDVISADGTYRRCVRTGEVTGVGTSSNYIELLSIPHTVTQFEGEIKIKYSIASYVGPQTGEFSCIIARNSYTTNQVTFFPKLANSFFGISYLGTVKYIYENDTTNRGAKLIFEVIAPSTTVFDISIEYEILSRFYIPNISIPSSIAYWDTNLPDGSSYITYGQQAPDWWRFGAGRTLIWSGSTAISASGTASNLSDHAYILPFTGFDPNMFEHYIAVIDSYSHIAAYSSGSTSQPGFELGYNKQQNERGVISTGSYLEQTGTQGSAVFVHYIAAVDASGLNIYSTVMADGVCTSTSKTSSCTIKAIYGIHV